MLRERNEEQERKDERWGKQMEENRREMANVGEKMGNRREMMNVRDKKWKRTGKK